MAHRWVAGVNFSDPEEIRARRRIRWLFFAVVVVFFAQFIGGKLWREPVPGLFAPAFIGDGSDRPPRRKPPPEPQLTMRFEGGDEESVPLRSLVEGAYYKQKSRWVASFRRRLASDEAEVTSQLVAWLVEKLSYAHPDRTLVELRWVYMNPDGSNATRTLWIHDPDRDQRR